MSIFHKSPRGDDVTAGAPLDLELLFEDSETETTVSDGAFDAAALDTLRWSLSHDDTSGLLDATEPPSVTPFMGSQESVHGRRGRRLTAFIAATSLTWSVLALGGRTDHSDEVIKTASPTTPTSLETSTPILELVTPNTAEPLQTVPSTTEATTTTVVTTTTTPAVATTVRQAQASQLVAEAPVVPKTTPATTAATAPPKAPDTTSPPTTAEAQPEFRYMSPNDFAQTWINAQPQPGSAYGAKPEIYGDTTADQHIRNIAESRGYRLQPESTSGELNPQAEAAFNRLAAAAKAEGYTLWDASDYRSPEDQNGIFQSWVKYYFRGVPTVQEIINGVADDAINQALDYHAAPGYSYHQTGNVIDLNQVSDTFMTTSAYQWLSRKNWYNARAYGFIPTRPPGTTIKIGSKTESWEIGFDANTASIQ